MVAASGGLAATCLRHLHRGDVSQPTPRPAALLCCLPSAVAPREGPRRGREP